MSVLLFRKHCISGAVRGLQQQAACADFGRMGSSSLRNSCVSCVSGLLCFTAQLLFVSQKATAPTPVLLPGKSHGRRSLVGYSPWGCTESDTTERLHFHFSLSCIGEGNGTPLQYSCLENPRNGGAWWAAIYGVAQSRTRLKRLSSSSSSSSIDMYILPSVK